MVSLLTERAVWRIIADLEAVVYILKKKEGRVNLYAVSPKLPLRRKIMPHVSVDDLL